MGLDDFTSSDKDDLPVQELKKTIPPEGYNSWSEYEPTPDGQKGKDVISGLGKAHQGPFSGQYVLVMGIDGNEDSM